MSAAKEGVRELGNPPAGGGERAQSAKRILRNEPKTLLNVKQLAFSGAQNERPFQGKNPPSKPITRRKIHHLWGIFLSIWPQMSRHILEGQSTSTCGLGARRLQSLSKCPLSQGRRRSGLGWHHACSTTGCGRAGTARSGGLRGKSRQDLTSRAPPSKSSLTKPPGKAYRVPPGWLLVKTRLFRASDEESENGSSRPDRAAS